MPCLPRSPSPQGGDAMPPLSWGHQPVSRQPLRRKGRRMPRGPDPARKPRAALTPVVPPPPPSRSCRFAPRILMPPLPTPPHKKLTTPPHQETSHPPTKNSPPCPPSPQETPHPTPHPIFPISLCTACIAHLFCVQICIAHLSPAKESPSASRQPFNQCHIPYWHMTPVSPPSLYSGQG